MSRPDSELYRRLQQTLATARQGGGRMFGGGGGGGPGPRSGGFVALGLLFGGGFYLLNNALFNVDGGHRAIKYTRIGGVKPDIYSEGIAPVLCNRCEYALTTWKEPI